MREPRRRRLQNISRGILPSISDVKSPFQSDINQIHRGMRRNYLTLVDHSGQDSLSQNFDSVDLGVLQSLYQNPFVQQFAVFEDVQVSGLNFDLLDQLSPHHEGSLIPNSTNISWVHYDMLGSMPQPSSDHQAAFSRSQRCSEGDALKLIIFMLDNNLLEDDQTRRMFLDYAQTISPLALSSIDLGSKNPGMAETIDKLFCFALEANNRSIVIAAIRNRLQVSAYLMEATFVYALRNDDLYLVRFLLAESNLNLGSRDPCANRENWCINQRQRFESTYDENRRYSYKYHRDMLSSSVEYIASRHNHPLLLALLQAGASPTTAPPNMNDGSLHAINPLIAAILLGDSRTRPVTLNQDNQHSSLELVLNVVRTLVENGADVNAVHRCSASWSSLSNRLVLNLESCPICSAVYFSSDNQDGITLLQVPILELRCSPICAAAYNAHFPVVTYLLDQGAEVHRGSGGQYALLSLTKSLNHCNATSAFEIAKTLINKGVDISITSPEDELTALDYTIGNNSPDLVELLLSKGATFTPQSLNRAISTGSTQLVHQILDSMFPTKDEKINPLDFLPAALMEGMDHIAPKLLDLALTTGHAWPSYVLYQRGVEGMNRAIVFILDSGTVPSPIWIAKCLAAAIDIRNVRHVHSLVKLSMEYSNSGALEWCPDTVEGALNLAITEEASELLDLLLECSVIPDCRAINASLMKEDFDLFDRFLKMNIQWCLSDSDTDSAYIYEENLPVLIRLKDHTHILQTLLAVEERDGSFSSFTECAVRLDDFYALKILLKWGYGHDRLWLDDVVTLAAELGKDRILHEALQIYQEFHGVCDRGFGSRALHCAISMACEHEHFQKALEIAEKLLSFGVNPLFKTSGCIPHDELRLSCSGLSRVISDKAILHRSKWQHLMLQSISKIDSVIEAKVINAGWIDSRFEHRREMLGYTPLLLAILVKDVSAVKLVLDAGADINLPATIQTRRTPLQAACDSKSWEIFLLLLSKGANVNAPAGAYKGGTALQLAAVRGDLKMVSELLKKKADVNAPGAKIGGRTALEGAAEYGRVGVLELLLDCKLAKIDGDGDVQYQKALKLAEQNGHQKAFFMLRAAKERRLGACMLSS